MYIQPNTNIYILRNVPLDPTYDHTIWWNNVSQQIAYFTSMAKYKLTAQTYARVQRGTLRVNILAENLYDCNYVMFQNAAFGNKWFYAFIKGVEYYNNAMSEITFEIDVMQTWFFDYQPDQCFIEREHSVYDNVGDNTVLENLEQGPYIVKDYGSLENVSRYICVITTEPQPETAVYDTIEPGIIDGVMNPFYYVFYPATQGNVDGLITYLEQLIQQNKGDSVIAILMCPFSRSTYFPSVTNVEVTKQYGSFDGYAPKNQKLYTYPYNLLHIYNDVGSMDLRYELFANQKCEFAIFHAIGPAPSVSVQAVNYGKMGVADSERQIISTGFPMGAWVNDTWKRYFAENQNSIVQGYASAALQGVVGVAASASIGSLTGAVSSAIGAVDRIATMIARQDDIRTKPPEVNGQVVSSAQYALGQKNVFYKKLTIRPEYAKIIDDYFTMYGYATHRVKVPNRNSRPHWNYVKTVGCVITGSIPADDAVAICNIYNAGITFWKDPDEVGDYSLDNQPGVG